jgi:hypothetical protein
MRRCAAGRRRRSARRLLDAADHHGRLAEVGLSVAGRMVQRHEHLPAAPAVLADVVLHDGVAAGEPVLVAQPLEHPLRGVALLGPLAEILQQPPADDLGEPVKLRPLDLGPPPVAGRHREAQHLLHALARDPEMTRRRALAHPVPTGETDLPIQIHGEDAPALPAVQERPKWPTFTPPAARPSRRYRGRLLHRRFHRGREFGDARLTGRHLQDVRRQSGRLPRRHPPRHPRRASEIPY